MPFEILPWLLLELDRDLGGLGDSGVLFEGLGARDE